MTIVAQASFNSGEWSPKLYARVDLQKYRAGAALLQNFYVDYRGGVSTRPGTKQILQCYKSSTKVRLIGFQASFNVGYVLEFGDRYIRFYFQGSPVLENGTTLTAQAPGNPTIFTDTAHGYSNNDWLWINGNYYIVQNATANTFSLTDLFGNAITGSPFTLPVNPQRVYTISSPYTAADLAQIKFAQNVSQMILCHPSYPPQVLTLITSNNWTLLPITFGSTASAPSGLTAFSTLASGVVYYAYVVTTIDANGQESAPSAPVTISAVQDIRTNAGTNYTQWAVQPGAIGYNIYKAIPAYLGPVPSGATFGFIGTTTGNVFPDSNITPDFSQTPPVPTNPFQGQGIASVTVTNPGTYTSVPSVSATGVSSTIAAQLTAVLQVQGTPTVGSGGSGYAVNDIVTFTNGVTLVVNTVSGGAVTSWKPVSTAPSNPGSVSAGSTPANPVAQSTTSGTGTGATANLTWGVGKVIILNSGAGYSSTPTITFSSGGAAATAVLAATSNGFPSVPGFFQQRLVLAAPTASPQTFYMSQPGQYFNFNVSTFSQADDSISGTLVSGQLNTIRAMVSQPTGLLMFTDRTSWLINGGSNGSAVSPSALVANAQSFNGISDVPPIIANFDVLYVQAKGSIVRDSAYNIYANVYTGTDISALSSHLFYGYTITEWAWAEEPFKIVWAIRSDGVMLTLTFLKEQEFIGWAHSTTNGLFKSVAAVVEQTSTAGQVDAVYAVVQRTVNGVSVQYVERFVERTFTNGVTDAWCVDCGISYSGAPATNFSGAQALGGCVVTGLADGQIIPPFTMPASGSFTLTTPASKVVVGLGFTCDLQTLPIETGDPTIQGKLKKVSNVDVRVADTLGLSIGASFSSLVPMKDLVRGNVSSMLVGQPSQIVSDLVTGDARTFLDPTYTVPGQFCIRQSLPLPATVLGVFMQLDVGDGGQRG